VAIYLVVAAQAAGAGWLAPIVRIGAAPGAAGALLALIATLPWQSVVAGTAMFAVGLAGRLLITSRRRGPEPASSSS
jgi:hypothetical protein